MSDIFTHYCCQCPKCFKLYYYEEKVALMYCYQCDDFYCAQWFGQSYKDEGYGWYTKLI